MAQVAEAIPRWQCCCVWEKFTYAPLLLNSDICCILTASAKRHIASCQPKCPRPAVAPLLLCVLMHNLLCNLHSPPCVSDLDWIVACPDLRQACGLLNFAGQREPVVKILATCICCRLSQ